MKLVDLFYKDFTYLTLLNGIIHKNTTLFFRKKDRAMHMVIDPKAKYKLKWNVPLNDVAIVEYGPGVNILTSSYRTTISHSKEGRFSIKSSKWFEHTSVNSLYSVTFWARGNPEKDCC